MNEILCRVEIDDSGDITFFFSNNPTVPFNAKEFMDGTESRKVLENLAKEISAYNKYLREEA